MKRQIAMAVGDTLVANTDVVVVDGNLAVTQVGMALF